MSNSKEQTKRKRKSKKLKLTKERMDKILYLDLREAKNIRRLNSSLILLPFIKNDADTATDRLEHFIKQIEKRYPIHLSYIMRSIVDGEDVYSGMVKIAYGKDNGKWLATIYGQTIWEVLAKTIIYMYYYVETNRKGRKG